MIGSGEGEVIVEELAEFPGEGRGKLWTTIRDNFIIEPEAQIDFVEKEGCYPLDGDRFLSGAENYPLCKAIVNHDQQRVETRGGREIGDEVTGDLLEGVRGAGPDQSEWGNSGMHV